MLLLLMSSSGPAFDGLYDEKIFVTQSAVVGRMLTASQTADHNIDYTVLFDSNDTNATTGILPLTIMQVMEDLQISLDQQYVLAFLTKSILRQIIQGFVKHGLKRMVKILFGMVKTVLTQLKVKIQLLMVLHVSLLQMVNTFQ